MTNAYAPARAAEELGVYRDEGLDAHVELQPALDAVKALRGGAVDFETTTKLGGSPLAASLPAIALIARLCVAMERSFLTRGLGMPGVR